MVLRKRRYLTALLCVLIAASATWWILRPQAGSRIELESEQLREPPESGSQVRPEPQPPLGITEEPTWSISGQVVDDAGHPMADAQVCATSSRYSDWAHMRALACVSSHSDGTFVVASHDVDRVLLGVAKPGYVAVPTIRRPIAVGPGAAVRGVLLRLVDGGVHLRGVVEDASGDVVEGASVSAIAGDPSCVVSTSLSDVDGAFALWIPDSHVVVASALAGYVTAHAVVIHGGGREVRLRMIPEATISGMVRDVQGSPVAGAWIFANEPEAAEWDGRSIDRMAIAQSGPAGEFLIAGLAPAEYRPFAVAGPMRGRSQHSALVTIGANTADVVIELGEGGAVTGRVVAAGSAEPVFEALIRLVDGHDDFIDGAISDGDGAFELAGPFGALRLEVRDPATDARASVHVVLGEHRLETVVELSRVDGHRLSGRVENRLGRGVPWATVEALGDDTSVAIRRYVRTLTDERGDFELDLLPSGTYDVNVDAPGYASTAARFEVMEDREDALIIVSSGGHLDVEIVDSTDEPVAEVAVLVSTEAGGASWWTSGTDGRISIPHLRPGLARIDVSFPGIGGRAAPGEARSEASTSIEIPEGGGVEVRLEIPSRRARVTGHVFASDGGPAGDVLVTALSDDTYVDWVGGERQPVVSESRTLLSGAFALEGLEEGEYRVVARDPFGEVAERTRVKTGSSVELTLPMPR